jgi:hypothetical protein
MLTTRNTRRIAICLTVIVAAFGSLYGQSNKTPEGRVKNFYGWYLASINKQHDPAKNKTVMNSHLSQRFSRWFYSKAGQNLDYDIFVNGQEWDEAWADRINIGDLKINRTTAVAKITLGSPPDEWVMKLQISLVSERGTWKIDRVKGM